jgi:hypothetical protein
MSVVVLPKSFDLSRPIEEIPAGTTSKLISVRPISGGTFTQNQIIECDLLSAGWIVPSSLSIRYKVTVNTDVSGAALIGCPVYAPFARVGCTVGGQQLENLNAYNQMMNTYVALNLGISDKYGLQTCFSYTNTTGSMELLDGKTFAASIADASSNAQKSFTMAAPLYGTLLSTAEKNIPAFALGSIRYSFTLDSIANMSFVKLGAVGTGFAAFTKFEISNFELCYLSVDMGQAVEKMVYDLGNQVMIKSHGFNSTSVSAPSGTSGNQSYVFNQRYASIRNAFVLTSRADGAGNKWAEFSDLTSQNGDYQIVIAGTPYPPQVLSTSLNKTGILQELRRAAGSLFNNKNTLSINSAEYNVWTNDTSDNLLVTVPGKFIVGVGLSRCGDDDKVMMSGVNSQLSAINVNVNVGTTTTAAANVALLLDYDAILLIDPQARQISVRS